MQKQRSPYTGGGGGGGGGGGSFNIQQLKSAKYAKTDGLNGVPFLVQLAQQSQRSTAGTVGHERGLRSGTPRSYASEGSFISNNHSNSNSNNNNNNNNNNNVNYNNLNNNMNMNNAGSINYLSNMNNNGYEGDMPNLPLGSTCFTNAMPNDDYSHMDRMDQLDPLSHYRSMEPQNDAMHGYHQSDTDSETEYRQHRKDFGPLCTARKYWVYVFDLVKSRMPLQRQERMELELRRCRAHSVYGHVLLMLQLLSIVLVGTLMQGVSMGVRFTQVSYRLWSTKFMLRGLVRQFLWRMANAKVNDVLLFLGILLITPWLFFISLIGFVVSAVFHTKSGLNSMYNHLCQHKD